MRSTGRLYGEMRRREGPEWGPLEKLLASDELCGHFMSMGEIELEDGAILQAYKHRWTRQYLHLTADGRAFTYAGHDGYDPIDPYTAITVVFVDWLCWDPSAAEKAALLKALHAAG